jgi:hypothetical protein
MWRPRSAYDLDGSVGRLPVVSRLDRDIHRLPASWGTIPMTTGIIAVVAVAADVWCGGRSRIVTG